MSVPAVRRLPYVVLSFLLALLPAAPAFSADAAPAVPGLRGELLRALDDARSKVTELAEAMPEAKYDWRPEKGVRSVGEVYLHMAQANYSLPHLMGAPIPADIDVAHLGDAKLGKAQTLATLKASFEHAAQVITDTPDSALDRPARIFGRDGTVREVFVILATHAHEHLGQSIAYARTNGVVPPWTVRADAAAAAQKATAAKPAAAKPADKP